jgi:hypothetical protein
VSRPRFEMITSLTQIKSVTATLTHSVGNSLYNGIVRSRLTDAVASHPRVLSYALRRANIPASPAAPCSAAASFGPHELRDKILSKSLIFCVN